VSDPAKTNLNSAEPAPQYSKSDSLLFQSWLILFLLVICFALVNYLLSYIPG
jgi:hypothetical protein